MMLTGDSAAQEGLRSQLWEQQGLARCDLGCSHQLQEPV